MIYHKSKNKFLLILFYDQLMHPVNPKLARKAANSKIFYYLLFEYMIRQKFIVII